MNAPIVRVLVLGAALAAAVGARAQGLVMARSHQAFPEAMATLQAAITGQGYTVARVQRVDVGLTASGFETDRYRVVFFGKAEEIRALGEQHPELIPYMPYKIAIFAEDMQTVLVATSPAVLGELFPDPALAATFRRWERDLRAIFATVSATE